MCHIPFSTLLLSYEKHGNDRKIFLQKFFCPSRSADCTWNWKHQTNNDHLNDLRLTCKLLGSLTHSPQSRDCLKDHYHWSQGLVQNLIDKMFCTGFSAQSLHRFVSVPACIIIALQQQLLLCFALEFLLCFWSVKNKHEIEHWLLKIFTSLFADCKDAACTSCL